MTSFKNASTSIGFLVNCHDFLMQRNPEGLSRVFVVIDSCRSLGWMVIPSSDVNQVTNPIHHIHHDLLPCLVVVSAGGVVSIIIR